MTLIDFKIIYVEAYRLCVIAFFFFVLNLFITIHTHTILINQLLYSCMILAQGPDNKRTVRDYGIQGLAFVKRCWRSGSTILMKG